MARGALIEGRPRVAGRRSMLGVLVMVAVLLAAGVLYVVWWLVTPADCTVLGPRAGQWTPAGYRPDGIGSCPVGSGDVVTAVDRSVPDVVRYRLDDDGTPRVVTLPLRPPEVTAALRGGWSILLFCLSLFALVVYLFVRRRTETASAALLLFGTCLLTSSVTTLLGLPASAATSPWRWLFLGEVQLVYTLAWSSLMVFTLSFPTRLAWLSRGRLLTVYLAPLLVLASVAGALAATLDPVAWVGGVVTTQEVITVVLIVVAMAISVGRFRSAEREGVARQQLRLLGAGSWTASALLLAGWVVPELMLGRPLVGRGWIGLPGLFFVAALGAGVIRYRLFDLDAIASRSIVYAGLTAAVVTLYLGVVTALATAVQSSSASPVAVVAAVVVALAVNPLRIALQTGVNRLMYGDRDDPYAALTRLGQRLSALSSVEVLPTVAADVARAMRVPFVAIDLQVGDALVRTATSGTARPASQLTEVLLSHHGEAVGRLVVADRAADERLSTADRRLLADLTGQVGAAVQVVRLNADLQRSRERLILAREEERRALRRTLHDDVGPTVAGLALRTETVRRLVEAGADERALNELGTLRRDASAAATDLRRLAYDLRPPSLDELGLLGALTEYAGRLVPMEVTVTTDGIMNGGRSRLPAAVEVAAYRIAVEAMSNAARHASARTCVVRLGRSDDGRLVVEVTDDGTGLPEPFRAGVGVSAMRERAVELGGECTMGSVPGHGTTVVARLPLAAGNGRGRGDGEGEEG